MDQAVVPASANALTPVDTPGDRPAGFLARLGALPMASKLKLGVGLSLLLAVVVALALWSRVPDYRVLFANLPDKEAGNILAALSQMNVPYRMAEGGGAILVPADQVHDVRLKLASSGLPKSAVLGFELMDAQRFGQTQTQERMNVQRALEGELTRTITALDAVQAARVHLALPNQNGFFREQQKPSASVVLTLHPGRLLDRAQVAGIVHLVASSVPELSPKAVSVLDGSGSLLSQQGDGAGQGLDEKQLQYIGQMESSYVRRIQEILGPIVGRENLRATVAADIDFSQIESTAEQFNPNQGNEPAAVRSQQSSERTAPGQVLPAGVPGAASNQPPIAAAAPLTGASQPLQGATGGSTGGSTSRESVTNFEVGKTVMVKREATGTVRRINAAVVVNHRTATDTKGKTSTNPLPAEEVEKLTALVQEAIGFNKDRGDSVRVINAPFRETVAAEPEPLPLWQQPWLLDLLRVGAAPLALAGVALVLAFGLVRPALKQASADAAQAAQAAAAGQQLDAVVGDTTELLGGGALPVLEAPRSTEKLDKVRTLARENPTAVANIVRDWVNGEAV